MRILLDVDGVCANWTGAVADRIYKHSGGEVAMDLTKWFRNADLPAAIRARVMADMNAPGFCYGFDVLPGAKEAIGELRAAGCEVHFVTSDWNSPTWVYDRNRWLVKHKLADAPRGVTYTPDKYVVKGDIFVDDKVSNVLEWREAWPNGIGIVWAQPWNADYRGMNRFNDWGLLLDIAKYVHGNWEQKAA
jgi:5'(3')-deoxyribonucleotidase